jgi:hypothetical protein
VIGPGITRAWRQQEIEGDMEEKKDNKNGKINDGDGKK